MHRIDTSTAQVDKFGAGKNGFTGGNPQTGELPTALDAEFFDSVQEEISAVIEAAGLTLTKSNRAQLLSAMNTLVGPGRLINVQVFKASAPYKKFPGTKNVIAEVQAAGGSGANTGYSGSSTVSLATGGSAGGYAKSKLAADQVDGQLVTVGTGGKPKAGLPSSGSAGGDSSIGSLITCKGGSGGYGQEQATPPFTCTGVLGGDATGGNIVNTPGGSSEHGVSLSTGSNFVGKGGDSFFGKGGFCRANNNSVGNDANGFGSGGGGAVGGPNNASTGYKGGAGADGIVIIWEYA
ncbi:carbohydrate kinase [Pantoea brenneri]|uniref:glycine-rich domain-containing protein n=1 Tax=Pantoea brenneri TaxID=472694 RepID=UPI0024471485|nr:carbohydrate kinase [Pantoea brenneri]MDH2122956.1 carbohydrate kinase [Pantoea brenneri]